MSETYFYESDDTDETVERVLGHARTSDEIEPVDAGSWEYERRRTVYFQEIMPVSIQNECKLGERSESRRAGFTDFGDGVLLTDNNVYVGSEVIDYLSIDE